MNNNITIVKLPMLILKTEPWYFVPNVSESESTTFCGVWFVCVVHFQSIETVICYTLAVQFYLRM